MSSPAPTLRGNWEKKRKDGAHGTEEAKAKRIDSVGVYQEKLKQLVADSPAPFDTDSWSDPKWQELAALITEEVTEDAVSKDTVVRVAEVLAPLAAEYRIAPKKLKRIKQKNDEDSAIAAENATLPESEPKKKVNFFRQVNDLCACRVKCSVTEISKVVNFLRYKGLEHVVYVRGSTAENPYGDFIDVATQTVKDIVQYVYLYDPYIGHIVEIQIGEPFALLAFEINSARRNDSSLSKLFGNGFIYNPVKIFILNPTDRSEDARLVLLEMARSWFQGDYRERLLASIREIDNKVVLFPKPDFSGEPPTAATNVMRGCLLWEYLALFSHEALRYFLYFTPANMLRPLFSPSGLYNKQENLVCKPVPYYKARSRVYSVVVMKL
jgi:hypothetical protein